MVFLNSLQKLTNFMEQNMDDQIREMTGFINNFNVSTNQRVEKSDLVFSPVDNCRKEFLLCFDMRTGSVRIFEFKKMKAVEGSDRRTFEQRKVAEIIKCVYGRYVEKL